MLMCAEACLANDMQFTEPNYNCMGNTTLGGYNNCRRRCDNYNNPPRFCPLFLLRGCTCKKDYIPVDKSYNPLRCVLPQDCPK
ncbi:TIL domain-containing protein [Nephila pilipes]|uniref:TIL domain-containing protein n=1 Tax=Nephila pilipes TaxID=299642 RepID=A0A8X6NSM7_NEPPI|nr:TIL domain-containing protein [Nephila pilipes]